MGRGQNPAASDGMWTAEAALSFPDLSEIPFWVPGHWDKGLRREGGSPTAAAEGTDLAPPLRPQPPPPPPYPSGI